MSNLSYPQIKADLDLCQTQLSELCQGNHNKAIMSVPPQATDFDMQISAAFDEVKAYRDTGLTPEEISTLKIKAESALDPIEMAKIAIALRERDTLKKALEKYQKAEQWLDDVNNPLEPIKVLAALNSEVMKLNYRREHKPESISELDGTIISALLFVQQAQEPEGKK